MTVKHTKVSTVPDGTDTSVVRPSDWNADHSVTPDTITNVLSDHNKANHDSLLINADMLDGLHSSSFVASNVAITGATKTKITYDSKGLVTAGADATTADIAASTDKNYVTDAQLVVIGNTSGTNTGDQTSVSGNAGSATTTAITDDTTTNATMYPTWVTTASGNQSQKVSSTKLTFNPSTATLTTTTFVGSLTGTASGNVPTTRTVNGKALSSDITLSLASADFANQGTATTVLHGNASGNPAFGAVVEADITLADNTTNNVSTTKHGFVPKAPNNTTQFLRADATWATVASGSPTSSGSYSGNSTANRAIAHGLGVTPRTVLFTQSQGAFTFIINSGTIDYIDPNSSSNRAVTAMDSTNFYVGNSAAYNQSANATGTSYNWVAIG